MNWTLGIVNDLLGGNDGLVRATRIQKSNGETSMSILELFPLVATETPLDVTSDYTDEQHKNITHRSTRPTQTAIVKAR